jgi:hypothetical protein
MKIQKSKVMLKQKSKLRWTISPQISRKDTGTCRTLVT